MMLSELTPLQGDVLPLAALRAHLRLGTGFGEDTVQDGVLETALRAAVALIERRCGIALLRRAFRLELSGWRDRVSQALPVTPVVSVDAVRLIDGAGAATEIPEAHYTLVTGGGTAVLEAVGLLPVVPRLGRVEIDLTAGFGVAWSAVPGDLAQAVLMQAAAFYEAREGGVGLVEGARALLAPWRPLRLGRGANR